jgi:L-alanine-DL-glutamate epimerase-like enolase superfamily enzyme
MLGKQTVDTLKRLASEGPQAVSALSWSDDGAKVVAVPADAADARVDLADLDRFSATLRELAVTCHAAPMVPDVRAWLSDHAAATIRALGFLEEPLAVWELEASERIAQLRSSPPHRDESEVTYWEVVLHCADQPSATLARYRWAPGMPERERVEYPATFALIGRMAAALERALTCEA